MLLFRFYFSPSTEPPLFCETRMMGAVMSCLRNSPSWGLDVNILPIWELLRQSPPSGQAPWHWSPGFLSHKTETHMEAPRHVRHWLHLPAQAEVLRVCPLPCCEMDGHGLPPIPVGRKWTENLPLPAMNLFIRLKAGMLGRAGRAL